MTDIFLCFYLHVTFYPDLLQAIDEAAFSVAYANLCRCLIPVSSICFNNKYVFENFRKFRSRFPSTTYDLTVECEILIIKGKGFKICYK